MAKAKEMFDSDSDSGSDSEGSDANDRVERLDSADVNVKGAKDSFTINESSPRGSSTTGAGGEAAAGGEAQARVHHRRRRLRR